MGWVRGGVWGAGEGVGGGTPKGVARCDPNCALRAWGAVQLTARFFFLSRCHSIFSLSLLSAAGLLGGSRVSACNHYSRITYLLSFSVSRALHVGAALPKTTEKTFLALKGGNRWIFLYRYGCCGQYLDKNWTNRRRQGTRGRSDREHAQQPCVSHVVIV